jgi:hypothetical protein
LIFKTKFMKRYVSLILLQIVSYLVCVFVLISCQLDEDLTAEPEPVQSNNRKNPFEAKNISEALNMLLKNSSSRIKVVLPSSTHNYVRFMPQTLSQVMLLQDLGYDLWDEPLDQHIEYTGDYYQQPGVPDSLNYFYTLIPANYSITQSVPYTILSQVILFDEDAGDEQDPEEDPWIPDPGPGSGYCYDEYGQPYICGSSPRIYLRQAAADLPEDLVKKTTQDLLNAGINLVDLYNQAMILAGYNEEVISSEKNSSGRTQSVRYYPAGTITVRDNSIGTYVPVKGAFIKSRRFFKLDHTYTNSRGYFAINKGYRNKAQVIVKFKNNWANVRGVSNGLKIWQWTHPVKVKLGLFEKTAMQSITRSFEHTSNAESNQAMQFTAAHALNTVADLNQYCATNSINTIPDNINLWVTTSNWFRSSTAPMLNKLTDPLQTQALLTTFIVPPLTPGSIAKKAFAVLLNYAPDVAITINNNSTNGPAREAHDIIGVTFHELAHAVHYNKVGRNYWLPIIPTYVGNFASTGTPYGNKAGSGAGLVAVTESWGFFIGNTFTDIKYSTIGSPTAVNIAFVYRSGLENQVPNNTNWQGWVPFGSLHDMRDVGEPGFTGVIDNVSGYSINGIFKGFTTNATTVQSLKQNILNLNNNLQSTQVNQLITSYGW